MEPTLRTFCIIPHEARCTDFFEGVFEDGLVARHNQCSGPLFFSHVLSPAHDTAGHVVDPLLTRLQEGGNAALMVVLPEDDDEGGCGSKIIKGSVKATGEKLEVAMNLFTRLLLAVFANAQQPSQVLVSAISFRVKGAKARDLLGQVDVHRWEEVRRCDVECGGSSSQWGAFVQLIHERHVHLIRGTLPRESVLLLRIEVEGRGSLMVAEMGCDSGTLLQLSLLLRSGGAPVSQTFQSCKFFTSGLRRFIPPVALAHLVGIPDPQPAPRGSLRLIRFMSVIFYTTAEGLQRRRQMEASERPSLVSNQAQHSGTSGEPCRMNSFTNVAHPKKRKECDHVPALSTSGQLGDDSVACAHRPADKTFAEQNTHAVPSRRVQEAATGSNSTRTVLPKGVLPGDYTNLVRGAPKLMDEEVHVRSTTSRESPGQSPQINSGDINPPTAHGSGTGEDGLERMKRLVSSLALRVGELEEGQGTLRQATQEWHNRLEETAHANEQLREQLQCLERSIPLCDPSCGDVPELTLIKDSARVSGEPRDAALGRPPSPKADSALLLALNELREQNASLEMKLQEVQQRSVCDEASRIHDTNLGGYEHTPPPLAFAAGPCDAVEAVATSLTTGCKSLLGELVKLEEELKRRGCAGKLQQEKCRLSECSLREHKEAVVALQRSVEDIIKRRYGGSETCGVAIPAAQTVEDFDKISNILTFELERGAHLRAFIPTFALLSMAVERLRLMTAAADS